jgi:putative flippase GtrA
MDDKDGQKSAKRILKQFIRFNMVGALNTLITYLIYSGLVFAGLHYQAALALEYSFGIVFSYVLNKRFTFAIRGSRDSRMFMRMLATYIPMLFLNAIALWLLVDRLGWNKYLGQAVALVVVAGLSFLAQRAFVFGRGEDASHGI